MTEITIFLIIFLLYTMNASLTPLVLLVFASNQQQYVSLLLWRQSSYCMKRRSSYKISKLQQAINTLEFAKLFRNVQNDAFSFCKHQIDVLHDICLQLIKSQKFRIENSNVQIMEKKYMFFSPIRLQHINLGKYIGTLIWKTT